VLLDWKIRRTGCRLRHRGDISVAIRLDIVIIIDRGFDAGGAQVRFDLDQRHGWLGGSGFYGNIESWLLENRFLFIFALPLLPPASHGIDNGRCSNDSRRH
jgi:hypothetical protein